MDAPSRHHSTAEGAPPQRPPGRALERADFLVLAVGALVLAGVVILDALRPGGRGFLVVTPVNPDSICYFSTAHSLLFDGDFDLANQFERWPYMRERTRRATSWFAPVPATGLPGSPYAIGYSLLGLPFLALGTGIDALAGQPADGYGPWATRLFVLANVVWLTLGLLALRRWLQALGIRWRPSAGTPVAGWALTCAVALVPATTLGYYVFTVMSHTASFFAVTLFFAVWWTYRDAESWRPWAAIGALAGLMTLCRWQEALMLAAPLTYEAQCGGARRRSGAWWRSRAAGGIVWFAVLIPQLLQWKLIYGELLTVPQGAGFLAWPPQWILPALFSSHNGLFFTTPATLVGALGLVWAALKDRMTGAPLLLAFTVQVAVVGSMPTNWHGSAFAMRNLTGALPILAAGALFLLLRVRRPVRLAALVWSLGGCAFTLLAAVQWRFELVPRRDRLTFDEAFSEKLRIPRGLERHRAGVRALREPDAARRVEELERVLASYGESRPLLKSLSAAYDGAGIVAERERVEHRLAELAARRLF